MTTRVATSSAFEAATSLEKERRSLRRHVLSTFQNLTDRLKEKNDLSYVRRYTYIGPRVARTKFYRSNDFTSSTDIMNIVNEVNKKFKGVMNAKVTGPFADSVTVYLDTTATA